jgi:hypothetical protein
MNNLKQWQLDEIHFLSLSGGVVDRPSKSCLLKYRDHEKSGS